MIPINPAFLSPTHRCSSLVSLHLGHSPRLRLTIETMRGLLTGLPSLETLKLDECHAPPTLPLSALSELAPLCPRMKSLTLYMDTIRLSTSAPPKRRFRCLEVLSVGCSPLKSSAINVAKFLAAILPDTCILKYRTSCWYLHESDNRWKPVVDFLPFMLELRAAREKVADASTAEWIPLEGLLFYACNILP